MQVFHTKIKSESLLFCVTCGSKMVHANMVNNVDFFIHLSNQLVGVFAKPLRFVIIFEILIHARYLMMDDDDGR